MKEKEKEICVVNIIDEYTVILNAGADDGIQRGDKFMIYELSDVEVEDPKTHELLGLLELPKGCGEVINVQDKLCVLRSTENRIVVQSIPKYYGDPSPCRKEIREIIRFYDPHVGDYVKIIR